MNALSMGASAKRGDSRVARAAALLVCAACFARPSPGAEPRRHNAAERHEFFKEHLALRAQAVTAHQFDGIASLADWARQRPQIRRRFLDMLGLDPMPPRTPLSARVTGGFDRETYRVENVVFQSLPGLYVTGNLYLPKAAGKHPTVLYVSGHAPGPAGAKAEYQRHGIWFARNGFVAFVIDTIEFGEIPGIHHGLHNLRMDYWLSLGYTPAGVEVWNAIRALDYLETRAEVDKERFAMTGRSGGGAITWFTAAADERIHVAAPVHGTWSIGAHVRDNVVRENCDCIYFWNSHQLDLPIVAGLIAPRPLKIVNASKDGAFPPAGYDKVFELVRNVYDWYGARDQLAEFTQDTGHQDLPAYRQEANQWIARWLTGKVPAFDETGIANEEKKLLLALDRYPENALNEGIQRNFIRTRSIAAPKSRAEWDRRREEILADLKQKVFRAFPKEPPAFAKWKEPVDGWTRFYADSYHVEFTTEDQVRVQGQLFVPRNGASRRPALIYLRGRGDIVYSADHDQLLSAFADHIVLVLNPRAVDYPMDNFGMAATQMSAALTGATVETMQLWDLLRSIDFLTNEEKLELYGITVYGRKEMGALAIHAAALDPRVTRVVLDDPPASHWNGAPLLNVLRYTDLAEVAGLVAPRELVSLTALPATFDVTRAIYRLHGRPDQIRRADSLGQALRVWRHGARPR